MTGSVRFDSGNAITFERISFKQLPPAVVAVLVVTVATLHTSQLFFHNGEDFFFAEFCQVFGYRYK